MLRAVVDVRGNHPVGNAGPEPFRMKGALEQRVRLVHEYRDVESPGNTHEWTHFKHLVISRRPVIEHHEAEDVLLRICNGHGFAKRNGLANKVAHLKLVVHPSSWACWVGKLATLVSGFRAMANLPKGRLGVNTSRKRDVLRPMNVARTWNDRRYPAIVHRWSMPPSSVSSMRT